MKNHSCHISQHLVQTILSLLLFLALPTLLSAQDYGTHIELHGESVTRIFKDSRNLMWIGTSNGLLCYDGQLQIRFTTDDCRRPQNFVNDICELADGSILVGMRNGLYKVDFPSKTCKRIHDELTGITSIEKVEVAGKQQPSVVVVGCQQGIALMDGQCRTISKIVLVNPSNITSSDNHISSVSYDGKQTVWACNEHHTIVAYDLTTESARLDTLSGTLLSSSVNDIQAVGKRLYMATNNNGLLVYDIPTHRSQRLDSIPPSIRQLSQVGDTLFVCTDGGGLYALSEDHTERLQALSNSVYSCYYDTTSSTLWCGYYQQGFSYSSQKNAPFSIYKYKDFTTEGLFVRSFLRHGQQTVIGTRDGIYLVDEQRDFVRHFTPQEIQGAIIMDIKFFADQYIIANYEHGLFSIDPVSARLSPLTLDKRHQESSCSRLAVSPDGTHLYAASSVGLLVLDKQLQVVEEYDDRHSDIISTYFYDIMFDKTGKLWVSTSKGLCLFNPATKRFQSTGFPKGFFNNVPNITLFQALNGDILAASEQTLYYSSPDLAQMREYPLHETLGLGYISFIQQMSISGKPYQFIGTDCGLFISDMDFRTFHQYAQHDNIPSPQFQRFNAYEDEEGRLWMANAKGLVVCSKENRSLLTASLQSKVFIDRYTIDRKEQITNPFSDDCNTIRIGWNFGTDELVITPMLLDYSAHQSQRYYEWTLDGEAQRLCYDGNPIILKDLGLGTHRIRISLAGHPETALELELKVWPSLKFYGMLFAVISIIIMAVMVMQILKRRRQYHKILKQKHQIELELASHNAVRQHIQRQEQEQAKVEEERRQEKADKMKYKSSEYKELKARVKAYMETEKPYLNKNLRITEVAAKVGSNAGTLSLMFNDYMHTNYFDFINRYRIEHFKKLALDPDYAQYTVLAISEMCGLKRSNFFNVFKKFEGCTPSEWIKREKGS